MVNPINPNVNPNFSLEQSDVKDPSTVQGKAFTEKLNTEKKVEMQSKPSPMDTATQSSVSDKVEGDSDIPNKLDDVNWGAALSHRAAKKSQDEMEELNKQLVIDYIKYRREDTKAYKEEKIEEILKKEIPPNDMNDVIHPKKLPF